ncbi:hypothetical protein CDD82_5329 [Ophiocordyceps australis]|uniref:Mitochondrial intermediate peptidase n=1 Tax=Ophiocordyceps australis TaxID=1399860 RepID=A0A2C5Z1J7_9HYPO|nr:hypothetical protein CDD82_5329 [Ophiocordyceps australis]
MSPRLGCTTRPCLPLALASACGCRVARLASRCNSTIAGQPLVNHAVSSHHDDGQIRKLFDSPLSSGSTHAGLEPNTGLFKNRYLTSPNGFTAYAHKSLDKATLLVNSVLEASTTAEYQTVVRNLDRLSDVLCRVLDMSEFVRLTHPDERFQEAAAAAWSMVYDYMNLLNTMAGLCNQLDEAMSRPQVTATWSEEEMTVAKLLKLDFMKSAVNLPEAQRKQFVDLSARISDVGSKFANSIRPESREVVKLRHHLRGLNPSVVANHSRLQYVAVPSTGPEYTLGMQSILDQETREELYIAHRTASTKTVTLLESMLRWRARLAHVAGFESYAHMSLKDRMMAKTPASVMEFLLALRNHNAPVIGRELAQLVELKQLHVSDHRAMLEAWDKEFYMEHIRAEMRRDAPVLEDNIQDFFSVGTVMQGLSRLFDRLYGVRFVPREALAGETWHPDVKRLDVVSDSGDRLAVLYCDLFYRSQKSPNPAHFTVRCSRDILDCEIQQAAADPDPWPVFDSPRQAANDGMEISCLPDGTVKQLPTIALICDFPKNGTAGEPALLSYQSVETLFHEMGHALHSILARTSFQNVSGTRCATDLAELPSTLMEHFVSNPAVLGLFARHWKTDQPLPPSSIAQPLRIARRFEGIDTEYQLILALVDQALHSPDAGKRGFDSTKTSHIVHRQYALGPAEPPGTRWQGFFGHLHTYGSTYYSYLFDRVLAERVWRHVFASGIGNAALDRRNGEILHNGLLKWGGGRDPWRCLADTLKDERLAIGDETAMAIVGSWGLKNYAA